MQARAIPLEQVIDDVVNMGFSRHEVSQLDQAAVSRLCLTGSTIAKVIGRGVEASTSVSLETIHAALPASIFIVHRDEKEGGR